jgi:hypothetical protein
LLIPLRLTFLPRHLLTELLLLMLGTKNPQQSRIVPEPAYFTRQQKLACQDQLFLVRYQSCLGLALKLQALKLQAHGRLVTLLWLLKLPQQALP